MEMAPCIMGTGMGAGMDMDRGMGMVAVTMDAVDRCRNCAHARLDSSLRIGDGP